MGKSKGSSSDAALKRKVQRLADSLSAARGSGLSSEKLQSETRFLPYMQMLKGFAQRYCVMVAVCDTPVGPATSREITGALKDIGLTVDLFGKFRYPYAALIDSGVLIFEKMGIDVADNVDQTILLDEDEIKLVSISHGSQNQRKQARIQINGKEYSTNSRGLNFVIYDKVAKNIMDRVNFDTYAELIPCIRPNMDFKPLREFARTHPGVSVVCWQNLGFPTEQMTPNEQLIRSHNITVDVILANLNQKVSPLQHYFDQAGIMEVLSIPKSYHDMNGVRRFEDVHGKYVNIAGGHRVTAYQPAQFQRAIYLIGGCTVFGFGIDDNRTIASYLQDMLNKNSHDCGIIVQNYGFCLNEVDRDGNECMKILNALPVKPGDIILYPCFTDCTDEYLRYNINLSKSAEFPRSYDVFFDEAHYTPEGNHLIAEKLFQGLSDAGLLQFYGHSEAIVPHPAYDNYNFNSDEHHELSEYKKILVNWYQEMFGITMGAVVMNCNPFTLGHRYLVEKALEQCDYLVIFAVQEDKSDFPFEDRLKLIDAGVADLKNVVVIPSGRFVLSSLTFSEYFNKSEMQDRTIDTSLDVTVFAREIAPCLNIKKRFAGQEPFDSVTRQYNETMQKILPEYGIEFIEIPRIKINSEVISASRVRSLLKDGNLYAIKPLVPTSTFQYLCEITPQN